MPFGIRIILSWVFWETADTEEALEKEKLPFPKGHLILIKEISICNGVPLSISKEKDDSKAQENLFNGEDLYGT